MSKHEGVTCDSCNKVNFTGHRYKCLVCYDYDLCHDCHTAGASSSRHKPEHAMQCILTRHDMSIYFGGEGSGTAFPHQSFTCPYCAKLGFSVPQLQDHVRTCHSDNVSSEIICPICAVQPNGDPNLVTEDLVSHINQMHNNKAIDQSAFASEFLDDATGSLTSQTGNFRQIRRLNHPTRMASFGGPNTQTSALRTTSRPVPMQIIESALSPRDPIDPIAELLSQLTNVRPRGTSTNSGGAIASHLQHLELQLATTRQQLERFRQVESLARTAVALGGTNNTQPNNVAMGVGPKNVENTDASTKKKKVPTATLR